MQVEAYIQKQQETSQWVHVLYVQVEAYMQKQQEITQLVHVLHICK